MSNLVLFPASRVRSVGENIASDDRPTQGFLLKLLLRLIKAIDNSVETNVTAWIDDDRLVVGRSGAVRGVWEIRDDQFSWIPAGFLLPRCQFPSVQDAASYTIHCIFQHPFRQPRQKENCDNSAS